MKTKGMMKSRFGLILIALLGIIASSWSFSDQQDARPPVITDLKFGTITIDGTVFEKDVVIENGTVRQRKKGPSKSLRKKYGHTPLTSAESIPWNCDTLVIGIGMSSKLPVTKEFKKMAKKKGVTLILFQTPKAVDYFTENYGPRTNAIFHITC